MPPKKKGKGKKGKTGKKGKKGGKGGEDGGGEGGEAGSTPVPSEKESLLIQELAKVTEELESAKKNVEDLRKENEWLQQEAQKVRVESHEYMGYMEKKTTKRQTTIITLSDHNKQEIRNIELQKEIMEEEFNDQEKALKDLLLEKQNLLTKTSQELSELSSFKQLQTEQLTSIKNLEKEVMKLRSKHSETIQQLKSQFLRDKREYQQDSENKIATLERKANKEAITCLTDHTNKIKLENRQLRKELLELIHKTRALQQHKQELEDQRRQLEREQQYSGDLKKLRTTRQHKVFKSFGLLGEGEGDENNLLAIEEEKSPTNSVQS